MTKQNKIIIGVIVGVLVLAYIGVLAFRVGPVAVGGGVGGTQTFVASSSRQTLSAGAISGIAGTSTCVARVVTSGAAGVALSFMDQPLTGGFLGTWQAASTTVTYPAETFGCGGMRARADGATTVGITEFSDPR